MFSGNNRLTNKHLQMMTFSTIFLCCLLDFSVKIKVTKRNVLGRGEK